MTDPVDLMTRVATMERQLASIHALALPLMRQLRQAFIECHTVGGKIATMDEDERAALAEYDTAIDAMAASTITAQNYERRIRADERERCAQVAARAHGGPVGA